MKNELLKMIEKRKIGIHCGVPSFCSANKIVIEAIMEQAKRFDDLVLIEATSNQVNQYGGYMNMKSKDFRDYVYKIAEKIDFDKSKIVLGGDHLGPLTWCDEASSIAMEKAKVLVRECVLAGYTKIHLDTSMKLYDDPSDKPLSVTTIAERGAFLYKECEDAFLNLKKENPDAIHPVFIIGSEVPIPGGSQENNGLNVTTPEDFENTILTYKKVFKKHGLDHAWKYIIGIVVQPGVEFGNNELHIYNRLDALKLCETLKKYPDIVFEGHSTDYQPPVKLKEMVEDGIAIIKVGPALTFAVREGLFALSYIEKELINEDEQAYFIEKLEEVMLEDKHNWIKHYHGTSNEQKIARKYSFSDRCRYYLALPEIVKAQDKLIENLKNVNIPLGMLHQFMPKQYIKVRDGLIAADPYELVKDYVVCIVEDYNYAVKHNYMISEVFIK